MTERAGPEGQHVLRFAPTLAGLEGAASTLRALLDAARVEGAPRHTVELAFEEVATNIARHGKAVGDVELRLCLDTDKIVLTFEDDGILFDPRDRADPVAPTSIDDAPVGGLGLVLLRKMTSRMVYERTLLDRNILTLTIPRA